ncbi:unnamed protein product [Sphagnum troendelagicum]
MCLILYRIDFCVHDDDLLLPAAAAAPPLSGQQEEVANRAALVQIPGRSRNSPAVAAATTVVVGKVPDFCVTLTKFAVDWSDAGNHNQQQQAQLVSEISYFPYSSSSQVLLEVISKHLPKQAVPLILRAKLAVDGHNHSASSSSQSDVGSTRMPLTGICLKSKSLDPSNCDPDEEEEEECCYRCAAAHYEFLLN